MMSLIFSISASHSSPALKKIKYSERAILNVELPLGLVNLGNFEDYVRESSTNTLDDSKGEHDLSLSIDVGVLNSENVLEFGGFLHNEGLKVED